MEIEVKRHSKVHAKEIRIHCKVSDMFTAHVYADDGGKLGGQDDGYVPDFMPGSHFGDYVILNIDLNSGLITNWKKPTAEQIQAFIAQDSEDE